MYKEAMQEIFYGPGHFTTKMNRGAQTLKSNLLSCSGAGAYCLKPVRQRVGAEADLSYLVRGGGTP